MPAAAPIPFPRSAPLLSVVIPTVGRCAYLGPLLDALGPQIAACPVAAEVVVVDNDPAGSAALVPLPPFARYLHAPQPGVAHARNAGVAAARGAHVIFLDDDETPEPGWLAAFAACAARGADAAFGPIDAAFDSPPPARLRPALCCAFGRRLTAGDGADISAARARLGTGNAMFSRRALTFRSPPFDPAFDAGGEDVWLLRQLVEEQGIRLIACPAARVRERVPPARCTLAVLRRRRFRDGQLRCIVERGAGGLRAVWRVTGWMVAGAAQMGLGAGLALLARPVSPRHAVQAALMACGGAGKLCWWWDGARR